MREFINAIDPFSFGVGFLVSFLLPVFEIFWYLHRRHNKHTATTETANTV